MKILSFDIEDWFHILDNESTKNESDWTNFETRIHVGLDIIFNLLENSNNNATFFVLGWVAEKYPKLIRKISEKGYNIGSHSHLHQLAYQQEKTSFKNDVEKSIKVIEDCIGKKVTSFRAPGFSIKDENKWAFEILYELGIRTDSSVFPAGRAHGGLPQYKYSYPSLLKYNGVELKEFPINTKTIFSVPFIFSGGGYFRFFPYYYIKKWTDQSSYIMTYFHPRDFDINQPKLKGLSFARKFKCYYGIDTCEKKLNKWILDYKFIDLIEAENKINWKNVQVINI